jgi:LmbE family N-acetylglucosaminyl deacetylase
MKFHNENGEVYVFDGAAEDRAFARTTHLAVAAHQDDVEIMAVHGALECFGQSDKWFSAVIVTNGSGSPRCGLYEKYSDADMMEVRREEQKKAAAIGGYGTLSLLMYPSSAVKDGNSCDVVNDVYEILQKCKPEVVYTHNLADKHDTHVSAALRTIAALRKMDKRDRPKTVYGCEVWRALDWLPEDKKVKLDVGKAPNLSAALMGVFDSQITGGKRYDLATDGRRVANATYADDHAVDTLTRVTYAMDLTPLIQDDALDVAAYVDGYLEAFKKDVAAKIAKFR